MNKFIQRFKNLPWSLLLQSVALTYLITAIAEIILIWGVTHFIRASIRIISIISRRRWCGGIIHLFNRNSSFCCLSQYNLFMGIIPVFINRVIPL